MVNVNQTLETIVAWVNGWRLDKFIKNLFAKSQQLWDKISPEVQEIIKSASGVVELIRKMSGQTPQFILDKIHDVFPFFSSDMLAVVLQKVTAVLNIASDVNKPSLVDMVAGLSKYIAAVMPDALEGVLHTVATWVATFATPEATTFGVITAVMKYVFENYVKGKIRIA